MRMRIRDCTYRRHRHERDSPPRPPSSIPAANGAVNCTKDRVLSYPVSVEPNRPRDRGFVSARCELLSAGENR